MQRRIPAKFDLRSFEVTGLDRAQPVPIGQQDQAGVAQ
jgi:hypothetical protein